MNRNFQLKAKPYCKVQRDDDFVIEMKDWFYYFTYYIETEMEEKDALSKLKKIIQFERTQGNISTPLLDFTMSFLTTKFENKLTLLCNRHFMYSYSGNVSDNCFTESENSRLGRDSMGPKPAYELSTSVGAIIQNTDEAMRLLKTDAMR